MTQPGDFWSRLLAVIQSPEHKAILFRDLDKVPVGSIGYLSPSGRSAARGPYGWVSHEVIFTPRDDQVFTSHSGPANDEKLAELLEAALVPENTILVSFEAVTDAESDWELGYSSTYTDLANPTLLGRSLDDTALAQLYFQIEAVGGPGGVRCLRQAGQADREPRREACRGSARTCKHRQPGTIRARHRLRPSSKECPRLTAGALCRFLSTEGPGP